MKNETTIFVVDEDNSVRNRITRLLGSAGYSVKAFACLTRFMESVVDGVSGCILLDIRKQSMSIEEIHKKLCEYSTNLKIIVITSDDSPEIRQKASDIGAIGFFRKPIDSKALIDSIGWALKGDEENI